MNDWLDMIIDNVKDIEGSLKSISNEKESMIDSFLKANKYNKNAKETLDILRKKIDEYLDDKITANELKMFILKIKLFYQE